MTELEKLTRHLSSLPGIGPKSARRISYHLLKNDQLTNEALAESIRTVKEKVVSCSECGAYTETDPCPICSDPNRDHSLLCIVENAQDVDTIASSGVFQGVFFVLGGAISPLDGIGPESLNFSKLEKKLSGGEVREIVIATNPTESGDTTALYIRTLMRRYPDIKTTRLASGLPIGGDLEYADKITIARSLKGRVEF